MAIVERAIPGGARWTATMDFEPRWWCRGGHRMTLAVWGRPRRFPHLPPSERRFFSVGGGTYVLADCSWQPEREERPVLVALHGLEGSSDSHYMKGLAEKAWAHGFSVIRLNQRNCGGTEHFTRGLYHSGLTADARAVVEEIIERDRVSAIALAGYSLGANIALKLAGEYAAAAPPELACVAAVSPPIDLLRTILLLERRANLIYRRNFLWNIKRRIRRKRAVFPNAYSTRGLRRIRTIRAFDDLYTAPHNGFEDAADYYARASALQVMSRITIPTLVITAKDDPVIPIDPFQDPRVARNRHITVQITEHGGHCGFLANRCAEHDGYWAEWRIVEFAREVMSERSGAEQEEKAG